MYSLFRPLLFKMDPENVHRLTLRLIRLAGILPPSRWLLQAMFDSPDKPVNAFGLIFKNPVGLAAGYDKDAVAVSGLAALGFGHLELGTVTPLPQPGNPCPRIFRLAEDRAVINRMGFPGQGSQKVARRIAPLGKQPGFPVIGINLGKNRNTPLENAVNDYVGLVKIFAHLADYLAINISSPNTLGLRRLQGREMLENLLRAIAKERQGIEDAGNRRTPVLVKLSPDLSDADLDDALDVILRTGMDGVIATNTSLGREGLHSRLRSEEGGLSGAPLRQHSEFCLRKVVEKLNGRLPVISVGGIMSPQDARRRLEMGAALVQIYTGLIYAGPRLAQKIIRAI